MEIFQFTPLLLDKWRTPLILSEVRTESVADWNTLPPVCFVCQPGIVGQKSCPRKIYNPPTFELYGAPPPPFQMYGTPHSSCQKSELNKLASLEAKLVRNYNPMTGMNCRATSVDKEASSLADHWSELHFWCCWLVKLNFSNKRMLALHPHWWWPWWPKLILLGT